VKQYTTPESVCQQISMKKFLFFAIFRSPAENTPARRLCPPPRTYDKREAVGESREDERIGKFFCEKSVPIDSDPDS
jgi:hypothetical protein